ncbi:hypothetical protein N7481_001290 [Penicillium waksmanii]|uniref:uncharacterized protein n=1 Tax=Penicillium waksmanii TaxID=69791 RepID=UPI002548084C|nr:uncharacterized protein N7481_001290 [Penicillium waksmanii]KAJ6000881.1 hypothetical protein N7481_001290 [Penicillium waksmanii]
MLHPRAYLLNPVLILLLGSFSMLCARWENIFRMIDNRTYVFEHLNIIAIDTSSNAKVKSNRSADTDRVLGVDDAIRPHITDSDKI